MKPNEIRKIIDFVEKELKGVMIEVRSTVSGGGIIEAIFISFDRDIRDEVYPKKLDSQSVEYIKYPTKKDYYDLSDEELEEIEFDVNRMMEYSLLKEKSDKEIKRLMGKK